MTDLPLLFRQDIASILTGVRHKIHKEFAAFKGHFEARQPQPMSPPIFLVFECFGIKILRHCQIPT